VKTVVQLLEAVIIEATAAVQRAQGRPEGREFALAKTAAEDAMMRYTRGRAIEEGVQKNFDFDADRKDERT
jgi:hypothetical protein